ncbi:MAG: ribosome small subunit-dependent GTPase A [Lentisphaerales bacterium]|nr:ribosome small subunit-dependent GTPase A [Lentisphaerales bacterium]
MGKKSKKKKGLHVDGLSERERVEIFGRAAKLRKASINKKKTSNKRSEWKKNIRQGDYDQEFSDEKRTGKGPKSLDVWAEKALAKAGDMKALEKSKDGDDFHKGVLTTVSRQGGKLLHKGQEYDYMLKPEMLLMQKTELAVGDDVLFTFDKEDHCLVEQRLDRKHILSRPDPTRPGVERVIAVNMDFIVIVSALTSPDINYNLIDRFLIGVEQSKATPIICINKCDLITEENEHLLDHLKVYEELGFEVIKCSAETGDGVDALLDKINGSTCVFLGTSGVGKSSLLNSIDSSLNLKTSENRERAAGRGRHTTVMAQMYNVQREIKLIDTPGVREFNFIDIEKTEIQFGFKEFVEHIPCKFNNCLHINEKGCNIIAAVEEGTISQGRYDSYLKILKTLDIKRLGPKQRDNLLL